MRERVGEPLYKIEKSAFTHLNQVRKENTIVTLPIF